MKYPQLFPLVKCVLSISQGNSIPERGFSINKHILDIHGNSTQNDTIVAFKMVKDHISSVEGIMNVSINKQFFSSVQSARQRYHCDLEAKRKQSEREGGREGGREGEREQLKVNKEKEAANRNEKVNLIIAEIKLKESGLAVVDDLFDDLMI